MTQSDLQLRFALELDMDKVQEMRMDLTLQGERKETVIYLVRRLCTYGFYWGCFPSLFSSLLLGLQSQNRQLCPSIAP